MAEVAKKEEVTKLEEVLSKQLVTSIQPVASIQEVEKIIPLNDKQVATLDNWMAKLNLKK